MTTQSANILVVEDETGMRITLTANLEGQGYQVTALKSGKEALKHLQETSPDVVIADLRLPDLSGLEILEALKESSPESAFILITGYASLETAVEALNEGAFAYINKPFNMDEVYTIIRNALRQQRLLLENRRLVESLQQSNKELATEVAERKRAEKALAEQAAALARAEEAQRSRQRIIAAQEGLRRDIAAHLHGRVQGKLLALSGRLQELLRETTPSSKIARCLGEVVEGIDLLAGEEISVLSHRLYPAILRRGLVPAIQSLTDRMAESLTVEVQLDEKLVNRERSNLHLVPEPVRLAAYRITEDALNNVVKHSRASRVTIELCLSSEDEVRLKVRDNGQGFDVVSSFEGLGLAAMRDYAEAVGGRCYVTSKPGEGTEVSAILPLAQVNAELPG